MYLGIDLGTSSVKLILLNDDNMIIAQTSQSLHVSQPKPLWSEQNPEEWWQATCHGIHTLRKKNKKAFASIKSIGLSGQQHGATFINAKDEVLRPAILWNDGRSMAQCKTLEMQILEYPRLAGSRLMPGFTAPKTLWVAEHEPDIFKKIAKILLPKDYLRLKITGEYATDMSDASGTGWLDIKNRTWSPELLNACHLTTDHMPNLFEGSDITGTVTKKIAEEWGVSPDTVVVGGGGDNPASAISMNVIHSGSAFLSLGTSGVYFVASNDYQPNPLAGLHTFCHCLPQQWHHMSVTLSAANCLTWLATICNVSSPSILINEVEKNAATSPDVIFLPYLSGERTPHNNPYAQGVFIGITHTTSRADLTRAVLEGVAFAFADGQDAILKTGTVINEVSVIGGGSQNLFWGKILASALQKPLIYRKHREVGAALGAARLASLAIHQKNPEDIFMPPDIEAVIEPDVYLTEHYSDKYKRFKNMYQRLETFFV